MVRALGSYPCCQWFDPTRRYHPLPISGSARAAGYGWQAKLCRAKEIMIDKKQEKAEQDRRRYARLKTVFPVEFQYIDDKKEPTSYIFQGFTRNVSKGGMCIDVKSQKDREGFNFIAGQTKLKLVINIPTSELATRAFATVRWSRKISEQFLDTYMFGVEYDEIDPAKQKMIERHVFWLDKKPLFIGLIFAVVLVLAVLLTYLAVKSI